MTANRRPAPEPKAVEEAAPAMEAAPVAQTEAAPVALTAPDATAPEPIEPAAPEPAAPELAAEQGPAAEKPAAETPEAVAEPAAEKHAAEEPAAEESAAETEKPAAEHPVGEEPSAEQPVAGKPPAEEPSAEQPVAGKPPAEEPAEQPAAGEPGEGAGAEEIPAARRRRPSIRASVVAVFLCGALGFALAAQLQQQNEGDGQLANARQSDLVRILDELNSREERLRGEIADLEFRRDSITSRAQGSEAALADARRRATELGILAGTLPAEGPGLVMTLTEDEGERLPASTLLDTIEELRGAGAEAMQIDGAGRPAVRIGVSTYFADTEEGIDVDGQRLTGPYRITVIGDPATMERALNIPGGIVESVREAGGATTFAQSRTVQITAVREVREPRFARPAS
jgi:uncharacterized protein YlxW (UPF0749 family)